MESCTPRPRDLDFDREQIIVRGGKADRDRLVMLPRTLCRALATQARRVRVRHARDLSRPMVFTIAAMTAGDLEKDAGTLRRKDMFDGRSFNATRVELKRGAETLSFDKSKGKDGKDVWKNAAGKEVDAAKVEDMLTKLSNIRALLFQDRVDPVLKTPTLVATLKLDNNMMEAVTFARSGNAVLASREGEPGSATVEVMAFNDAMSAIDAVK